MANGVNLRTVATNMHLSVDFKPVVSILCIKRPASVHRLYQTKKEVNMVVNSDGVVKDKVVANTDAPVKPAISLPIVDIDDPQYPNFQEDTKYPPIPEFEVVDRGHNADPKKEALLSAATKIIELTPHIGMLYLLFAFFQPSFLLIIIIL
jgi:hypothetical protein